MHDAVPVTDLLRTVFESIIEVFVLCLAGLLLARAGITDKATQRKLNRLNISLFTPCLLFSKVAFSLNPQKIKELWIVPLGFVVVTGTSMATAWGLGTVFRLKKSQKAFAMAASGFMNSNSLPIALMQSLVVEVPGLKWDEDDTKEAMLGRALTYLVLYSTLGMMLRWSFGVRLLTMADDDDVALPAPSALEHQLPAAAAAGAREHSASAGSTLFDRTSSDEGEGGRGVVDSPESSPPVRPSKYSHSTTTDEDDPWKDVLPPSRTAAAAAPPHASPVTGTAGLPPPPRRPSRRLSDFYSFPNSPTSALVHLPGMSEGSDGGSEDGLLTGPRASGKGEGRWRGMWIRVKTFGRTANEFMTVPMWSALVSIVIAMIPPVQAQLATLRPIRSAIKSSGACSIPLTLIVLGAYFYGPDRPPAAKEPPHTVTRPPTRSLFSRLFLRGKQGSIRLEGGEGEVSQKSVPGEKRTVFVAVFSRMVLTPLLLIPAVALLAVYDPFEVAEDPVFISTAVLIISSPPAITLAQITQASSGDAFESLISKTIWISYGVLSPPLTLLYVVIGLCLSRF